MPDIGQIYYDRDGIPITMERYCELLRDLGYKRVARTTVMDAGKPDVVWEVSTVWLGLDHSFGDGPPLIFETMVFGEGSSQDEACSRYATLQQAKEGHAAMVVSVAAELVDPVVMDVEPDRG